MLLTFKQLFVENLRCWSVKKKNGLLLMYSFLVNQLLFPKPDNADADNIWFNSKKNQTFFIFISKHTLFIKYWTVWNNVFWCSFSFSFAQSWLLLRQDSKYLRILETFTLFFLFLSFLIQLNLEISYINIFDLICFFENSFCNVFIFQKHLF